MRAKSKLQSGKLIFALCGAVLLLCVITGLLLFPLTKSHEKLLRENGWTVSGKEDTGMGIGEMSGAFFKSGAADPWFAEYVTQTLCIEIGDDDRLVGYAYSLEEICIMRNMHAYALERDGELLCAAVWGVETIPSVGASQNGKDMFYPIDTLLVNIRVDMLQNLSFY